VSDFQNLLNKYCTVY